MEVDKETFCGWTEKRFKKDKLLAVTVFCLKRSVNQKWIGAMVGRHTGSHHYSYRVSSSFASKYAASHGFSKSLQFQTRMQVINWLDSLVSTDWQHTFCSFTVPVLRPPDDPLFTKRLPNILWEAFLRDAGYLRIHSGYKLYKIYPTDDHKSSQWKKLLIDHKVKAGYVLKFVKRGLMEYDVDVYGPRFIYKSFPWQYIDKALFSLEMADDKKPIPRSNVVVIDP